VWLGAFMKCPFEGTHCAHRGVPPTFHVRHLSRGSRWIRWTAFTRPIALRSASLAGSEGRRISLHHHPRDEGLARRDGDGLRIEQLSVGTPAQLHRNRKRCRRALPHTARRACASGALAGFRHVEGPSPAVCRRSELQLNRWPAGVDEHEIFAAGFLPAGRCCRHARGRHGASCHQ
jgi:hypothetical protein